MIIKSADFVKSATRPAHYPEAELPEVAFAGRSNVGKSSLINVLVNRKALVRTSSTPGRTQLLNFFTINDTFFLVDLPGYGFAQVPLAVEVRHGGWFEPPHQAALHALLGERNMANVIIDTRPIRSLQGDLLLAGSVYERMLAARQRKPDLPIHPVRTASFTFLRYIGHPQLQVNQPYLMEWSERLAEWLRAGADAYVFCHCPLEDMDPLLCRQLHRLVAQKVSLEALPWDDADAHAARQERLF